MAGSSSSFKELVNLLSAEHDRVVQEVMAENKKLKEMEWFSAAAVPPERFVHDLPISEIPQDELRKVLSIQTNVAYPLETSPTAAEEASWVQRKISIASVASSASGVLSPTNSEPSSPKPRLSRSNSKILGMLPTVNPEWLEDADDEDLKGPHSDGIRSSRSRNRMSNIVTGEAIAEKRGLIQQVVMRPTSTPRFLWDMFSILLLVYDVMLIPLEAFSISETYSLLLISMDWLTVCFWTGDIGLSFITGFHKEGIVEMRPKHIAIRYLKTWFFMDILVVSIDWAVLLSSFGLSTVARLGKTNRIGRIGRIIRTVRLIRSIKLQFLLSEIFTYIKSDMARTMAYIQLMLVGLFTISHYLACAWWAIGVSNAEQGSWVTENELQDENMWLQYLTSLHWSLTQFTPASMEVFPQSAEERLYAICVVLFGIVTFSSFVSSITNGMMTLRKITSEPARQEATLRQYFKQNHISAELGQRIWMFLKQTYFDHRKVVHRKDIEVLKLLPESLRGEMSEELYLPHLERIPFFEKYFHEDTETLCSVVHRAVAEVSLIPGEDAFKLGDKCIRTYLLTSGTMDYWHRERNLCDVLGPGDWASESSLWLLCNHFGDMRAHTCCEVIQLDANGFRETATASGRMQSFLRTYAGAFQTMIAQQEVWYTDLWMDTRELREIVNGAWEACEDFGLARKTSSMSAGASSRSDKESLSKYWLLKQSLQRLAWWKDR